MLCRTIELCVLLGNGLNGKEGGKLAEKQSDKKMLQKRLEIERELLKREARKSFWMFCKVLEPDFYTESKTYLREYCNTLQALYEGRIVKDNEEDEWFIVETIEEAKQYGLTCNKLMINMPPQHGKSRTLVNFCRWALGVNQSERIISVSYNDDTASDFSKYTRDGISEESIDQNPSIFIYSDIFPDVKVKRGSSSYFKWALEGQHFNYLGTGLGGSVTSKSGTIRIIDDPIKSAEEAFNEAKLNQVWQYYTGTFLSRMSGKHIDIINHTRWADKDLCGRLLVLQPHKWYIFKKEAYYKETDTMLCPELLSKEDYEDIKETMIPEIFYANYHQKTIDAQNRLYSSFKTYKPGELPEFEKIISYTDTADEGTDYLCQIIAGVFDKQAYVLDVYYTQDAMEITEAEAAKRLYQHSVGTAHVESNNGGRGWARSVEKILRTIHKTRRVMIKWFHQSKNKKARILSNASNVINNLIFPDNWNILFPDYYEAMTSYSRKGKNKNDDAPDCSTGLLEKIEDKGWGWN